MNDRSNSRRPPKGRSSRSTGSGPRPSASNRRDPGTPRPDRGDRPFRGEGPRRERPSPKAPGRPGGGRTSDRTHEAFGGDGEKHGRGAEGGPRNTRTGRSGTGGRPQRPAPGRGAPQQEGTGGTHRTPSKRAGKRPPKALRDGAHSGRSQPERGFRENERGAWRKPRRVHERAGERRQRNDDAGSDGLIRLNRYLSNAGVASRRDADKLIQAGVVTVNGKVVTELGTKVGPGDRVHYGGQRLRTETKRYVLVNKPKDFITTTDDPHDRRTVMALIDDACTERLYPVGRLDRNTTGLLLMTNDGDLAKKLTHPSHGAEKIYAATLDKPITRGDLEKLVSGVELEDGTASADEASYVTGGTKKEVGIKLHMGRNRVVRRMFEALGYEVVKLDRVVFAGLTKRDLPRGKWRHLTEKEVLFLSKRK